MSDTVHSCARMRGWVQALRASMTAGRDAKLRGKSFFWRRQCVAACRCGLGLTGGVMMCNFSHRALMLQLRASAGGRVDHSQSRLPQNRANLLMLNRGQGKWLIRPRVVRSVCPGRNVLPNPQISGGTHNRRSGCWTRPGSALPQALEQALAWRSGRRRLHSSCGPKRPCRSCWLTSLCKKGQQRGAKNRAVVDLRGCAVLIRAFRRSDGRRRARFVSSVTDCAGVFMHDDGGNSMSLKEAR